MTARIRSIIRRLRREEDGSLLLTALIFVTAMGLVVGAMTELAAVNMRNTVATRDQREIVYTANSAVNAAIEAFRHDSSVCPDDLPTVNDITTATIECLDPDTGSSVEIPQLTPPRAVMALTTDPSEHGFYADSAGDPWVKGGLWSGTDVAVSGGANLTVDGDLTARSGCSPTPEAPTTPPATGRGVTYDPAAQTNCTSSAPAPAYDPDPAVSTAPPVVALPPADSDGSCPVSGAVTMNAGTYTDANALNDLFADCSGRVFWFPPGPSGAVGVYYFNFTSSSRVWTVSGSGTKIVAGTLTSPLATIDAVPDGDRCEQEAPGVQFIFGGESRIEITDAKADICAHHDPTYTNQEIAIYGLTNDYPATGPGLRRLSGCLSATPYTGSDSSRCALLKTTGNPVRLMVHGTVYAPLAALDIEVTNRAREVLGRGVVVRALKVRVTGSSNCSKATNCSPFKLPDPRIVPGTTTLVFQATVEGNRRLRALVEFPGDGSAPVIRSWSTINES